jgi:hypothetical protein
VGSPNQELHAVVATSAAKAALAPRLVARASSRGVCDLGDQECWLCRLPGTVVSPALRTKRQRGTSPTVTPQGSAYERRSPGASRGLRPIALSGEPRGISSYCGRRPAAGRPGSSSPEPQAHRRSTPPLRRRSPSASRCRSCATMTAARRLSTRRNVSVIDRFRFVVVVKQNPPTNPPDTQTEPLWPGSQIYCGP